VDKDLELLHKKIDFLTEQVVETQRRQREFDDLKKDLTPVVSDLMSTAVEELDQIAPHFTSEDLIYLLKKILRNTRQITAVFEQFESATDFIADAAPLSKAVFDDVLERANDLEQRGYFDFFHAAFGVLDTIVTHYSADDIRLLGENITTILDTFKQMTQPEIMQSVQNAMAVYQDIDIVQPERVSMFSLIRQLFDPEVQRSLATGLAILKKVSENLQKYSKIKTEQR